MNGHCTHKYIARHLQKQIHTSCRAHLYNSQDFVPISLYLVGHFEIGERDSGSSRRRALKREMSVS